MKRAIVAAVAGLLACSGADPSLPEPLASASAEYVPGAPSVSYAVGVFAEGIPERVSRPTTLPDAGCRRRVCWGDVPGAAGYHVYRLDGREWFVIVSLAPGLCYAEGVTPGCWDDNQCGPS